MTSTTSTAPTTDLVPPVRGTVWQHVTRTEWDGVTPKTYTVTSFTNGKVYSRDSLRIQHKVPLSTWAKVCGEIVSVPTPESRVKESGPKLTPAQCGLLYAEAHAAGMLAGSMARPEPMHVVQRENPFDDTSRIIKRYEPVMDGVCGFGYIVIRPGTGSFARWCRTTGKGFKNYYGGWSISVHAFDQSYERKMAYAGAFADVLRKAGITASPEGRLD